MPTDLTPDQRMAVSCAIRRAIRRGNNDSIDRRDLYQIGAEAMLRVKINDAMAPAQRHVYLEQRARGAMLDAIRSSYRQMAHVADWGKERPDDDGASDAGEPDAGASPERIASVHEACRRIERMPEPCPTVAAMAAGGADCEEIAAALGVSVSRISQHRATIRKVLEKYV